MAFEKMIKNAFEESMDNSRFGDTIDEIKEIQEYIKNAIKYKGQNSFAEFMGQYSSELVIARYKAKTGRGELTLEEKMMIDYDTAGAVSLFENWVKSGMTLDCQQIAELHYKLMPEELKKILD